MKYYLRVEAMNLSSFLADTQDLSTIRGGNLLLLNAVDELPRQLQSFQLTTVTTGASAGLYLFDAADDDAAKHVREEVLMWLRSDERLRYATVAVDYQIAGDDSEFAVDLASLISRNRWRQMTSLSISLDEKPSDKVCELDKMRPAIGQRTIHEKERWLSQSVIERRDYGLEMKQQFYQDEISELHAIEPNIQNLGRFVWDFEQLASDPDKGNLHRKIALIFLDGNRFNEIKQRAGGSRHVWAQFDRNVKTYRRKMLASLLEALSADSDWKTDEGLYRFETLLWGGDELIWVVPAWKGWETLRHFYTVSEDWNFNGAPLCHAGGIIFCHHKAPIHRLITLARQLVEHAKAGEGRKENRFAYEVLESFDHAGSDFDAYRESHCPQPLGEHVAPNHQKLTISSRQMEVLQQAVKGLQEKLPRGKLHDVVEQLLTPFEDKPGETDDDKSERLKRRRQERKSTTDDFKTRLKEAGISSSRIQELEQNLGSEVCWLHLNALWDYLI